MRVWVLGLTDVGRSPRLQNHAVSLAQQVCILLRMSNKIHTYSEDMLLIETRFFDCPMYAQTYKTV